MLYGLLLTLFIMLCFFIILIVCFVQKSRSSMGMGALGGSTQILFGGSGGQDYFKKLPGFVLYFFVWLIDSCNYE